MSSFQSSSSSSASSPISVPRKFQKSKVTFPTLFGGSLTLPLWHSNEPPKLPPPTKPVYSSYQSISSKPITQRSPPRTTSSSLSSKSKATTTTTTTTTINTTIPPSSNLFQSTSTDATLEPLSSSSSSSSALFTKFDSSQSNLNPMTVMSDPFVSNQENIPSNVSS